MGMGPGLWASSSSQQEFGYGQMCSPITLAQGPAWEMWQALSPGVTVKFRPHLE